MIRKADEVLAEKFASLSNKNLKRGVIKIDVEGMEKVVLEGLSKALPENFKVVILFESWDKDFSFTEVVSFFNEMDVSFHSLVHKFPYEKKWPRVIKFMCLLLGSSSFSVQELKPIEGATGDIIIVAG